MDKGLRTAIIKHFNIGGHYDRTAAKFGVNREVVVEVVSSQRRSNPHHLIANERISLNKDNDQQLQSQKDRIIQERSDDPNVNILGKPPVGRSALDQKRQQEPKDASQRNPLDISTYIRTTS